MVLGLLLLLVLPLCLRLWPIGHGLPRNYVSDTHFVRNALGMARDKDPVPPVGRYSTYPNLLPYVLLPVFAGEYALGRVTGRWDGAQEFGQRLMEEPQLAHLPARIVVALIAALAPLFVFLTARAMGMAHGAWVAAYLVATGLLHLHFSVQERPWAPLCTFVALSAWPAALFARGGRVLYLLLSGLAASLAFSAHQAGLLVLGLPGLAWLLGPWGWRGAALGARMRAGFSCVAVFGIAAIVLGYPYLLVHGGAVEHAVVNQGEVPGQSVSIGGLGFVFAVRWESTVKLARALVGYDPALVVLSLLGFWAALRARASRPAALFALFWGLFFLTNQADHIRYLLPLAVLLAWPAGRAAEALLARGAGVRLALGLVLAVPLVQALRLGWVLRQEDTRSEAERVLGATYFDRAIAVDVHGPALPLNLEALQRLATHRELGARERHRLTCYQAGVEPAGERGFNALPLEAVFDYHERDWSSWVEPSEVGQLGEDPNGALERLGMELVLAVDRSPDDGRLALLLDDSPATPDLAGRSQPKMEPLRVVGPPLLTLHPAAEGEAQDANLPGELSFPLTQLWQLVRPGPKLELYRLR